MKKLLLISAPYITGDTTVMSRDYLSPVRVGYPEYCAAELFGVIKSETNGAMSIILLDDGGIDSMMEFESAKDLDDEFFENLEDDSFCVFCEQKDTTKIIPILSVLFNVATFELKEPIVLPEEEDYDEQMYDMK